MATPSAARPASPLLLRLRKSRRRSPAPAAWAVALAGALVVAAAVSTDAGLVRPTIAAVAAGAIVSVTLLSQRVGFAMLLAWLIGLGTVRRVLDAAGYPAATDLLLLVGPAVLGVLLASLLVGRRLRLDDAVSKLVVALLVIAVLGVANPRGGGLVVGVGGLLFVGAPLVWFLVGRAFIDDRTAETLALVLVGCAVAVACYGLAQIWIGFPSWDSSYIAVAQYTSPLRIGNAIRPFASLTAPSEYLIVVGSGLVTAVAFALRGRPLLWLAVPLLAVALFLGSGRSTFAYTVVAVASIGLIHLSRGRRIGPALVAGAVIAIGGIVVVAPLLTPHSGGNSLISHQVSGYSSPLDGEESTLPTHWREFREGIATGFRDPIGSGTGSTNAAADTLGGGGSGPVTLEAGGYNPTLRGTDIDVSNVFVALGAVGGLLYVCLIVAAVRGLSARVRRAPSPTALAVVGIAIVSAGQWLTGGHYAAATVLWLLLGWGTASVLRRPGDPDGGATGGPA